MNLSLHHITVMLCLTFSLGCMAQTSKDGHYTLTSTADGSQRLAANTTPLTGEAKDNVTITLSPEQRFQPIDGFGYALTYSTCYNLLKMSATDRHQFLEHTFSPTQGYGASYVRISIGCNDFSSKEYTLCDKPGLKHFALQNDEISYVLPILREVLDINPQLKIIAAPWTCPRWMKVKDLQTLQPYESWTDGHLNPAFRKTYAQYFVKFIEAMHDKGFNIYAVSPQNEPLNRGNCASLYMSWEEEASFVAELAPAIKHANLQTRIYVYDHNYNYDNIASQNGYPVQVIDSLNKLKFAGSELVVGAAYHNYGGHFEELNRIHRLMPDKELLFSETSIGTWNNGRNLSKRLVDDMRQVIIGTLNNWCRGAIVWNLMLDDHRGPNLDGGCQTCDGAVNIDSRDYHTITFNSHYYIISHAAAVVKPGAIHIGATSSNTGNIDYSAFVNPDGSYAVLFASDNNMPVQANVTDGKRTASVTLPAHSVVSLLF